MRKTPTKNSGSLCVAKTVSVLISRRNHLTSADYARTVLLALAVLTSLFKSKSRLEAENAVLRHQLIVLRRKVQGRARLANSDRWFFIQLYRRFPPPISRPVQRTGNTKFTPILGGLHRHYVRG